MAMMNRNRTLIPVILLGSGVALTACGLIFLIAKGAKTPPMLVMLILVGIIDGGVGLAWAIAGAISRMSSASQYEPRAAATNSGPGGTGTQAESSVQRTLLLASVVLTILFVAILSALAFYSQLILGWLRSGRPF